MEQLPVDIEEKLERLPIVPFDGSEEFQNVIFSSDFNDIFDYYSENYMPDVVKSKPELYQRVSLYLTLTNQDTSIVEQTDEVLYRRPCPTIHEFLNDNFYMGYSNATLYPFWKDILEDIFKQGSPIRKTIFGGSIGIGKAQPNSLEIVTPIGKRKIGDIKVGDYLFGKNGKRTKVLNVFPQGKIPVYKITFSDNTSTLCCENHNWLVFGQATKRKPKIKTTKELLEYGFRKEGRPGFNFQIPFCEPIEYSKRKFEIDPYVLGVLLGDGSLHKSVIDIANKDCDDYIMKKVEKRLPQEYVLSKKFSESCSHYHIVQKNYDNKKGLSFAKKIKKIGLNVTSYDKFIPEEYFYGSVEQRLELLRGLMDTDGSCVERVTKKKTSTTMFSTVSYQLAKDISFLVRSLGGRAKISCYDRTKTKKNCNYCEYNVHINLLLNPFSLPRKVEKFVPHKWTKSIINIEKMNYEEECTCFQVDSDDHLYLTNDFIVTHNSTVARKAFLYVLYRVLCLRYPRAAFNIDQDSTIANVVIATTLKQVYEVNLLPFVKLMESMPCFQRVMSVRSFENFNLDDPHCPIPFNLSKSDGTVYFPDNIILTSGSNAQHFTGMNVINSFCDEINDYGTIENTMALLNTLDNRFSSRFQGSDLVFQSIVSSARTENSAMGEYIRHLPKNDPSILLLAPKLYEVKPDPEFRGDGTVFWVQVGNGSIPSKIITDPGELKAIEDKTYEVPAGCVLIDVPTPYRSKFELQLDQSIQDIAGMTTSDNNSVFRDTTRLEEPFLTPEMYFDVSIREDVDILSLLEPYNLFEKTINDRWQFKRAPMANRYIHCDLSGGGSEGQCDTGLCVLHKEWRMNPNTKEKEVVYVVDLQLFINAKNKVDIHAIQTFLINLVVEKNIPIHTVSFDQYNSLMIMQQLEASGCFVNVEKVSVDIKLEPYTNAATLMEKGQVKIGKAPKLKKELEALIIDKGKVTRTTELKDAADSLVGAIWDAQMNYADFPVYEFKDPTQQTSKKLDKYEDLIDLSSEVLIDL